MKLKQVETRQFAGIRQKQIHFADGLNLLIGENEAGKSTMIQLIYRLLYQKTALHKREDREFLAQCFPSDGEGDLVDGRLVFAAEEGDYALEKRWGAMPRCELLTPAGRILADEEGVQTRLGQVLHYRRGLYDDVVFASQKRQAQIVENILKDLDRKGRTGQGASAKEDLVSIIAGERLQSADGLSPADLEMAIRRRIDEYTGHWDFTADGPDQRRGIKRPWKREVGKILAAYYAMAQLEEDLEEARALEAAVEEGQEKIAAAKEALEEALGAQEVYQSYAKALAAYKQSQALQEELKHRKAALEKDLTAYPLYRQALARAEELAGIQEAARAIRDYRQAKEKKDALEEIRAQLQGQSPVSDADQAQMDRLQEQLHRLQGQLGGLDLTAAIQRLGDARVQVRKLAGGAPIPLEDGPLHITESVEILVPGLVQMTLTPGQVDVPKIRAEMDEKEAALQALLSRHQVDSAEALQEKKRRIDQWQIQEEMRQAAYRQSLGERTWEEIEAAYAQVQDKELDLDGAAAQTWALCDGMDAGAYAQQQRALMEALQDRYDTKEVEETIRARLEEVEAQLQGQAKILARSADIPEEIRQIPDPEGYEVRLKRDIELANRQLEGAREDLVEDERQLGERTAEEILPALEDARADFAACKREHARWAHILQVLQETREDLAADTTMTDVEEKFAAYLSQLTDGGLRLHSMNDRMDVKLTGGAGPLAYDILSEGTKDTIAIAFRLAMLEHLFPEGGGLVVLDDPFTDMDERRTRQACRLVQEFARRGNQVIFVTCDNKYRDLLGGNVIEMGR